MNASHRHGAHPFEPPPGKDPKAPDARCAVCGERWNYIEHHPTRIRAARALEEARKAAADSADEPGTEGRTATPADADDR